MSWVSSLIPRETCSADLFPGCRPHGPDPRLVGEPASVAMLRCAFLESQARPKLQLPWCERRSKAQPLAGKDVTETVLDKCPPQNRALRTGWANNVIDAGEVG